MGNCSSREVETQKTEIFEYSKIVALDVAERNNIGKIVARNQINFEVTAPILKKRDIFTVGNTVKVYSTVLPGLDPYGNEKKCQDNYSYTFLNDILLCGLFDGHGPVGEEVSAYSADYIRQYFTSNIKDFEEQPKQSLIKMLEKCDDGLKETNINYELSGTTACVVLLTKTQIHTASLGDSRAILATITEIVPELPRPKNKFCRAWPFKRNIKAIALTTDQKPNHEEEYLRIREAGGRVERITDFMGNSVGPYRVWESNSERPGLAMSRSIGDKVGKSVGVISTPVYHSFTLYTQSDLFIVMASDGVWDVMENSEVINFVDNFSERCELSSFTEDYPARPQNSSISRLLCEEARYRWFGLIEAEDVNIDDISCIVIEFGDRNTELKESKQDRRVQIFQSIAVPSEEISNKSLD